MIDNLIQRALKKYFFYGVSLLLLAFSPIVTAQIVDSCEDRSNEKVKTFVVRKASSEPEKKVEANESKDLSPTLYRVKASIPPSLASGDFGLMQVSPFVEGKSKREGSYVVFSFSIDANGLVNRLNIIDTNDRKLVDVLANKLYKTHWKPAKGQDGVPLDYTFEKWIVVVSEPVNKDDYDRHRFD